jgi:Protein of unknown function (DUF2891)
MTTLDLSLATKFSGLALEHVQREYPNRLDHVLNGPEDLRAPSDLHPIFYGSFDWHSNVHGYWLLATLYRRFQELPQRARIRALFDDQLTEQKVAAEVAYLRRANGGGFERPYGWAWLLMVSAELARHEADEGNLSDSRWHALQYGVRPGVSVRVCGNYERRRIGGVDSHKGDRMVRRRR